MARPVEFDRTSARDAALRLFWRKGYQGTSLNDLLDALEISRSSLYGAFGDKRALYLECVDQFADRTLAILRRGRTEQGPMGALRRLFGWNLNQPQDGGRTWGCLLVNTVLEMAQVDPALSAHASRRLEDIQAMFEELLIDAGRGPAQAADLAAFLMVQIEGLRVSSRRGLPDAVQARQIETTFRLLEAA